MWTPPESYCKWWICTWCAHIVVTCRDELHTFTTTEWLEEEKIDVRIDVWTWHHKWETRAIFQDVLPVPGVFVCFLPWLAKLGTVLLCLLAYTKRQTWLSSSILSMVWVASPSTCFPFRRVKLCGQVSDCFAFSVVERWRQLDIPDENGCLN